MDKKHLSCSKKSRLLQELGVVVKLEVGDFFYSSFDKLCLCISVTENEIKGIIMENNESISITNQSYCKAYIASEIIDLIPIDYCIPTRFEEGWAITFADGTLASTESSTYYDSQVDAAISFLLFLLKNNIK